MSLAIRLALSIVAGIAGWFATTTLLDWLWSWSQDAALLFASGIVAMGLLSLIGSLVSIVKRGGQS